MRNILILILVIVAVWWLRRVVARLGAKGQGRSGSSRRDRHVPERMIGCAHCGLHVPESEGVRADDLFYCCEEHRRLGARR